MSADLDELLGIIQEPPTPVAPRPAPRQRGRTPLPEHDPDQGVVEDAEDLLDGDTLPDSSVFHRPVNITFMAKVLGVEPRRLQKKLANCPAVGFGTAGRGKGQPLYDFREAIKYCVEPKMDLGVYIRSLGSSGDLPPHISKAYWDGQNAKLRWMERARHYWHDEDVLQVLGRTAMSIKEALQLWIENLPGKATMTTEQYAAFQANVGDLSDDIHRRLVSVPAQRKTLPVIDSMPAEMLGDDEGGE